MDNKFDAVLFDCDGVLVDSEPITNGLLRDMLEEQGWKLTPEACFQHFVGKAVMDEKLAIEANTGKPLTEAWMTSFRARRNAALETHLQAIPNIHAAIEQIHLNFDGRIACASGADRFKVELQLAKVDLMPYFEGRIFSGHEMPRSKPAPDVYLAAAAAVGVHPSRWQAWLRVVWCLAMRRHTFKPPNMPLYWLQVPATRLQICCICLAC
jgi:beta-phosphoglucomutase-like phosphatase (HAD superfamily)